MKKIKLIIFDLDGTLVDAYPAISSSFNYCMRKLRYPVQPIKVIRRLVGWGDTNLLRPFIKEADLAKAVAVYRSHHQKALLRGSRLFRGVRKVLRQLKQKGYFLAVASNRPTKFSLILMWHLRLDIYFDYYLCADKVRHGKPHPEILRKIMQRFLVKPKQTVYVGDMAIDAEAGNHAKVRTIIVTTGSSSKKEISRARPFGIIRAIDQLLNNKALFP